MKKEWIDNLREKLKLYEEEPPKDLWEAIEERLDTEKISTPRPLFPIWSKALLTAAAITIIALLITQRFSKQSEIILSTDDREIALLDTLSQWKIVTPSESIDKDHIRATQKTPQKVVTNNNLNLDESESLSVADSTNIISVIVTDSINQYQDSSNELASDSKNELSKNANNNNITPNPKEPTAASPIRRLKVNDNVSHLSLNIFAQNASKHHDSQSGYGRDYIQMASSSPNDVGSKESYTAKREVDFFNQNKEIKKETFHDLPITIGITGSYMISNKLAIEAGLTYTYLSSKTKQGTMDNFQEIRRQQHLIGLPIALKYNFWKSRNLDLYGSLGGAIERTLSVTSSSKFIVDKNTLRTFNHPNDPNYYIWSVRGSLGIRYNIYSNIGLYLEPGLSYHFTHSGMPESIYTEAPLKFSLSLGLNFRF